MSEKLSWSTSGNIKAGSSNQKISLQKEFDVPGSYTVQFNVQGKDIGQLHSRSVQARITWSVDGNSVSRVVDVVNGTSVSGTAEAVSVDVYDHTQAGTADPNDTYLVNIQVVLGTRPSVQQPPYLTYGRFVLGDGDEPVYTQEIAIPQDAGIISVYILLAPLFLNSALPSGGNPYQFQVIMFSGSVATAIYSPLDFLGEWVPVPGGTTRIVVTQNAILPDVIAMDYCVIFGIDG